jgi:hypothetical protein
MGPRRGTGRVRQKRCTVPSRLHSTKSASSSGCSKLAPALAPRPLWIPEFFLQIATTKEPTSGLEPLTCSLRDGAALFAGCFLVLAVRRRQAGSSPERRSLVRRVPARSWRPATVRPASVYPAADLAVNGPPRRPRSSQLVTVHPGSKCALQRSPYTRCRISIQAGSRVPGLVFLSPAGGGPAPLYGTGTIRERAYGFPRTLAFWVLR